VTQLAEKSVPNESLPPPESALLATQLHYRGLFEAAEDGILLLDAETKQITDANPFLCELLAYPRAELLRKELWELGLFNDREQSEAAFRDLLEQGRIRYEDLPLITKGGERREVEFISKVYQENEHSVIVCIIRDITERKRVQRHKYFLASVVASLEDSVVSVDFNTVITSWNKGAERLYGYREAEVLGKPLTMLTLPTDLQEVLAKIEQVRQGEKVEIYQTERVRKDGEHLFLSITLSPVRDTHGRVIGVSTVARDITERRRAEQIVRQSEAVFRRALEIETVGVLFFKTTGEITYTNDAFLRMSGYTREDLEAGLVRWDQMTPPEFMPQSLNAIAEFEALGRTTPYEKQYLRKDGSRWWALFAATRVNAQEGVEYVIDITEQVRTREALEEVSRLKDEFLATLSHELRSPLNSIVGYAEVLQRSAEARQVPLIRQAAEKIHRNAQAQAQLINDLLDLSRLQTGKLSLDRQPVSLAPLIGDAVESLRGPAGEKQIQLTVDLSAEPLVVYADAVRVQQIVWNLVTNAVKFTPNGGRVSVCLSRADQEAELVVEDTGQGIEPDFLPHLFEMFRQANTGTTRQHGGMGIGLALVKQLAELHDGRVEAVSQGLGQGAKFTVRLPLDLTSAPADTNPNRQTPTGELAGARILVVDDTRDALELLELLLTGEGAAVATASSGEEGLEAARGANFDLVISDISMPEMDGYEFLRRLRENPGYQETPAIAQTGFGREEDVERARRAGFITHLTKPIDFDHLIRLAHMVLKK
jgi:PAS domain S-box-containing protein